MTSKANNLITSGEPRLTTSCNFSLPKESEKLNKSKNHIQNIQKHQKEKNVKKSIARRATVDEVLFIFEKVLEAWKPIKIYNVCIQNNPQSQILKEDVDHIVSGNCKVFDFETTPEKFQLYNDLRQKVYDYHSSVKLDSKDSFVK
jgi:hypothetical protein